MRGLAVFVVLASLAQQGRALTWKSCGKGLMTPTSVSLSPDPAIAGKTINVKVPGTTTASVEDGNILVTVSYRGAPVYQTTVPICSTVECPVQPGPVTVTYSTMLPGIAPPGPYSILFTGTAGEGAALFCVSMDFQIKEGVNVGRLRARPEGATQQRALEAFAEHAGQQLPPQEPPSLALLQRVGRYAARVWGAAEALAGRVPLVAGRRTERAAPRGFEGFPDGSASGPGRQAPELQEA